MNIWIPLYTTFFRYICVVSLSSDNPSTLFYISNDTFYVNIIFFFFFDSSIAQFYINVITWIDQFTKILEYERFLWYETQLVLLIRAMESIINTEYIIVSSINHADVCSLQFHIYTLDTRWCINLVGAHCWKNEYIYRFYIY